MPKPNVPSAPLAGSPRTDAMRDRDGAASWLRSRTLAQCYCLLVGVFLLVRGASTLVAGASFALPGDGWRAAFQLLAAALLLLCSPSRAAAYRTVIAVGATYAVLSVAGIANGHDVLGILPVDTRDNIVHPALAILALIVGVYGPTQLPRLRRT